MIFPAFDLCEEGRCEEVVMQSNAWIGLVVVGAALALGGCGSSAPQSLGTTAASPGESLPVAHAPLTMPPDYNLRPGAAPSQGGTAAEQAQTPLAANNGGAALATGDTASGQAQSAGELALLQNAGA